VLFYAENVKLAEQQNRVLSLCSAEPLTGCSTTKKSLSVSALKTERVSNYIQHGVNYWSIISKPPLLKKLMNM